jgi:hypothetical protein
MITHTMAWYVCRWNWKSFATESAIKSKWCHVALGTCNGSCTMWDVYLNVCVWDRSPDSQLVPFLSLKTTVCSKFYTPSYDAHHFIQSRLACTPFQQSGLARARCAQWISTRTS